MSFKILISDSFSESGRKILEEKKGFDCIYKPGLTPDELKKEIKDADGLIIRSASTVTEDIIKSAKNLKLVARAGVGTDNVDRKAATENGVIVMNAPSGNSISTAEHAMALIFSLARNIPQAYSAMKNGKWDKKRFSGVQLYGKKMGIIGLGRIGSELAKRCYSCGMELLGNDPFMSTEQAEAIGIKMVDLETIYKEADFISVHVPLTDKTKDMIGKKEIEMMKKTTMLINCARGGVYNEQAIAEAVKTGRLAGAAFDVYPKEPPAENPFMDIENIITTPHLGASTGEAQESVAIETSNEVIDFFEKGVIKNPVNIPSLDAKLMNEMKSYLTLSEKLGIFLSKLAKKSIKEIIITYSGEITSKPVYFLTQTILKGILDPILSEKVNFVNAPILAKARGINVIEKKETIERDFTDLISVKIVMDKDSYELWGTIYGEDDIRFVYLNGFHFDLVPEGTFLVVHNTDVPGAVGIIGTILGNEKINIASMKLGRKEKGSTVLTILSIDGAIPESILEKITSCECIIDAAVVSLEN